MVEDSMSNSDVIINIIFTVYFLLMGAVGFFDG